MENIFDIRKIGDLFSDGIFICDKNGIIQYVNQKNEEISGIDREDCIGRHIDEFVGREKGIENTIAQKLLTNAKTYLSAPPSRDPDRKILEYGSPIFSEENEVIGAVVVDHDVTQLANLEEMLHLSESQVNSLERLNELNEQMISHLSKTGKGKIITNWNSPVMQELSRSILTASETDVTILLQGETGVGKEVFAREIVNHSPRKNQPFIKVNCSAIPANLIESELFGYERGAFTGASPKGRLGAFELANHGTLFLDEVGEIPIESQPKLLRAIQEREITRIGSSSPVKVDIRLIAATNRNLQREVQDGNFRADLYYRLNVVPVYIPPLRERTEDIPVLIHYFLQKLNRKYKKNIYFDREAMSRLIKYEWPGNIREMENMIERWCVLYPKNSVICWSDIYTEFDIPGGKNEFEGHTLTELMDSYERKIIIWGFHKYGSLRKMAEAMNIHYSTLSKICKRLEIDVKSLKCSR